MKRHSVKQNVKSEILTIRIDIPYLFFTTPPSMNILLLVFAAILSVHAGTTCNVSPAVTPPYKVSLCAMIHNEGWYIEEWIAYHLLRKVDHFYIYNDESTDGIDYILAQYIKRGNIPFPPFSCITTLKYSLNFIS